MRLKTNLIIALTALLLGVQAQATGVWPGVIGLWRTAGDEGLIRIEACGEAICGRIAEAAGDAPAQTDARNPDPALRARPIAGLLIMKLKRLAPGRWGEGFIYNPDNGRSYRASIDLTGDGSLRLRGCLVAPLCRTQTWTRVGRLAER
ncbi:MAG TPA: DUF2147 domain-containing protein [Caulobacteraceae bacterium]|jgi:uncharacterized protein (DUF2147 family)